MMPGFRETAVRRVTADGTVTTLAYGLEGQLCVPSILPNGYVLLCNNNIVGAHAGQPTLIDLGLKPQPLTQQRISPAAPATRTLASDLGCLLDQPDGTSDITLHLGEQSFRVHKTILTARSDYFKQRLAEGSGFADGAKTQLSLPDANPEAFALVLRFMYTGAVDIPAPLACPVAELANRLLLPELTAAACSQVLASVTPLTVVDALMWAEVCVDLGGAFLQLFKDLKAWFVVNYEMVASNPANSIEKLDMKPALTWQLLAAYAERASKRPRLR